LEIGYLELEIGALSRVWLRASNRERTVGPLSLAVLRLHVNSVGVQFSSKNFLNLYCA
jgi:hypothetical protein